MLTKATLERARAGDGQAFRQLTEPYRRELQVHSYRMLGSIHDAEDLVQETLLAAWRGLADYEGRASLRSWLYRIATNRCLNALRDSGRRPRTEPVIPPEVTVPEPTRRVDPLWISPYPDVLLELPDVEPGPEARYESKEAVSLAFLVALQELPPAQRATLVLRDVLGFRAAEVADMLDTTESSVTSALKRARATLSNRLPSGPVLPRSGQERQLVDDFSAAFARGDVSTILALLTEDAWLTMPPLPLEYQGTEAIGSFLSMVALRDRRRFRLVPTRANCQPAFGTYLVTPGTGIAHAHSVLVLTLSGDRIGAMTAFLDTGLFPRFGLPQSLRS
jgi:RNA polymerase sigma-70 factor (TIGR02960 family)